MDDIARLNRKFWKKMVAGASRDANRYTKPWLDLDPELVRAYARGEIEILPEPYTYIYPRSVFAGAEGKRVLCLASAGGQQSAFYGILGADVVVLDLTEEQLEGDRRAAERFGYKVATVVGDMRDLSVFQDAAFDIVFQAISICFVPDVREVYSGVARILKAGGIYRVGHNNPATLLVEETSWDGEGYRITEPPRPGRIDDPETFEFCHMLPDIFNGLVECGLTIREVWEDPRHLKGDYPYEPGTYDHQLGMVHKHFAVVAAKQE